MIEINLLPEDLRSKKEMNLGLANVIYFAKLGFIILAAIHLLLFFTSLAYKYSAIRLEKAKSKISSQDIGAGSLKREFAAIENRIKIISDLSKTNSHWAERLGKLSLALPNGVWFNHIRAQSGILDITGSVVSLRGGEVEALNKFLYNLKKDTFFYSRFKNINIVSIGKSNLFGVEVADFSIRGWLAE
jgi:Tfp pilus assembly protein PilN